MATPVFILFPEHQVPQCQQRSRLWASPLFQTFGKRRTTCRPLSNSRETNHCRSRALPQLAKGKQKRQAAQFKHTGDRTMSSLRREGADTFLQRSTIVRLCPSFPRGTKCRPPLELTGNKSLQQLALVP